MIDYQLTVDDAAETPRVTADRLVTASRASPVAAPTGARLLGHAEERARYARVPLDSADLGDSLRAVRGAIIGRVSLRTRLRATLLPASVLGRWRIAATETAGRITDTVTRWRAATSPRAATAAAGTPLLQLDPGAATSADGRAGARPGPGHVRGTRQKRHIGRRVGTRPAMWTKPQGWGGGRQPYGHAERARHEKPGPVR